MFSMVLYAVDDPENIDSLATAIWMCTVTVTTVGYGAVLGDYGRFFLCELSSLSGVIAAFSNNTAQSQTKVTSHQSHGLLR